MKLVSWNENGIRACLQKGFLDSFYQLDADIFCVQETKMQSGQADLEIEGYHYYLNSAVKKPFCKHALIPFTFQLTNFIITSFSNIFYYITSHS